MRSRKEPRESRPPTSRPPVSQSPRAQRPTPRHPTAQPLAGVAAITERLAVMLSAGIPPTGAWEYVAEFVENPIPSLLIAKHPEPQELADALMAIVEPLPATERSAWRGLAAAWSIAMTAGAPLAPVLTAYAESLRSLASVQRDIDVALAAPVATARLVLTLPPIGILLGFALGFDTLGVLFGSVVGWVCLLAGAALLIVAVRWNKRLVARAQPISMTPGIACELLAIAVSGGGSIEQAEALLQHSLRRFSLRHEGDDVQASGGDQPRESAVTIDRTIERVIRLSQRAGVPARQLLRSEAEAIRRAAGSAAEERAAALTVRLMLPLGLCVLPAFVLLGVVPMLITVVSSTVGEF